MQKLMKNVNLHNVYCTDWTCWHRPSNHGAPVTAHVSTRNIYYLSPRADVKRSNYDILHNDYDVIAHEIT